MKILKFGAVWCSGCIIIEPKWKEIKAENPWLETEDYDFNENKEIAGKYKIDTLPAFVFLDKENKEFLRLQGEVEKDKLVEVINQNKDK